MATVLCTEVFVGEKRIDIPLCAPAADTSDLSLHRVPVSGIVGAATRFVDPRLRPPTEEWRRPVEGSTDVSRRPFVAVHALGSSSVGFRMDGDHPMDGEDALAEDDVELPVPVYSFDPCFAYEAQVGYSTDLPDVGQRQKTHEVPAPYRSIDLEVCSGRLSKLLASVPKDVRTLEITGKRLGPRTFYWSWLPSLARFHRLTHLYLRHVTIDAEAQYSIESLQHLQVLSMIDCGVSGMRPPGWRVATERGTTLRHLTINAALLRANPYLQTAAYGSVVLHMTDPTGMPEISVRLDNRAGPAALSLVYPRAVMDCHAFSPPRVFGLSVLVLDGSPDGALPKGMGSLVRMRLQNMRAAATRTVLSQQITVGDLELPDGIGEESPEDGGRVYPISCYATRVICAASDPRADMYAGSIYGVQSTAKMF
jgi:hypothetical protein